jgi:Domain of unknown function (DUF4307)
VSVTDLNARYGRTVNRKRRNLIIAIGFGGAILIVFAAWTIWGGLFVPGATIDTEPVGNVLVSSNQMEVTWQISEAPGTHAKCAVQALDANFGIVGWKILTIPPSTEGTRNYSTIVRTAQPAVSGLIYLCWPT